jgi:glycosyltransferase involved in cell wall biosynthesis
MEPALSRYAWEVLFVDDSTDGTDDIIARLREVSSRIRLLHRTENRVGKPAAVVEGLARVHGGCVCVLDTDLQRPPARIPDMLAEPRRSCADLVVARRPRMA